MTLCADCGKPLVKDEKPANLKLVSRDVREFRCIKCLAKRLGCKEQDIYDYIAYLRESGNCTLFK